jgi:cytochrome P450
MEHMARNPGLQDELRANPELIPEAVEELLRRYSVVFPTRRVARDNNFHGAELREGERVSLYLAMANFDPAAFPEPERFDLRRDNKTHMSFVTAPHRCVGSHLARLEMVTFFEQWFARMPNVRLDPAHPPTYRTNTVYAVTSLPLLYR